MFLTAIIDIPRGTKYVSDTLARPQEHANHFLFILDDKLNINEINRPLWHLYHNVKLNINSTHKRRYISNRYF